MIFAVFDVLVTACRR